MKAKGQKEANLHFSLVSVEGRLRLESEPASHSLCSGSFCSMGGGLAQSVVIWVIAPLAEIMMMGQLDQI